MFAHGEVVYFMQGGQWRAGVFLHTDTDGLLVVRPVGATTHAHCKSADVRAI